MLGKQETQTRKMVKGGSYVQQQYSTFTVLSFSKDSCCKCTVLNKNEGQLLKSPTFVSKQY